MPRPKGSKNSKFHGAGGSRVGAGRPRNIDKDKKQTKLQFGVAAPVPVAEQPLPVAEEATAEVPVHPAPPAFHHGSDVEEDDRRKEVLEKLKLSFENGCFDVAMETLPDDDSDDEEDCDDSTCDRDDTDERSRAKYKPPVGSPVYNVLHEVKNQVKGNATDKDHRNFKAVHSQGLHWIQPDNLKNPVARGKRCCDPSLYYRQNVREVYVWLPFFQYNDMCQLCDTECPHCGEKSLQSHQYDWRPMFYFDRIVWVIHRRFKCKQDGCKKTIASINPRFLKRLPADVAQQFEFLSTTNRQVGMHKEMLYQFLELITDRVQFGAFADAFNSVYKRKYWEQQLSYYKSFQRARANSVARYFGEMQYPEPFSKFGESGDYNGMLLSKKTVKAVFLQVLNELEDYFQARFQSYCDEGASGDHTFQYANVIKAPAGRKGDAFGASYTIMSHLGFLNAERLNYSKSPSEIAPLLDSYKEVRDNAGAPPLAVRYSDDVNGDGAAWDRSFNEELSAGVNPYQHSSTSSMASPTGSISDDDYVVISSVAEANHWVEALRSRMGNNLTRADRILVGVDTEFHNGASDTDVLTVSFPDQPVGLFHLAAMKVSSPSSFPDKLKELLEEDNIFACARSIGTDVKRLLRLGVRSKHQIELSQLALALEKQSNGTSLATLSLRYLGLNVDKSLQRSDYSQCPLPKNLQMYAALDCLLHRKLATELTSLLQQKRVKEDSVLIIPPASQLLTPNAAVDVLIGGRKAAEAKVVFAYHDGESKILGNGFVVGKDKAIVEITSVFRPTDRIPKFNQSFHPEWPSDVNVGWVWENTVDKQIAVYSSNLIFAVGVGSPSPTLDTDNASKQCLEAGTRSRRESNYDLGIGSFRDSDNEEHLQSMPKITLNEPTSASDLNNSCTGGDGMCDRKGDGDIEVEDSEDGKVEDDCDAKDVDKIDDAYDGGPGEIRCRQQEDLWHQMKNLPLPKSCVLRSIINRLIVQGTYLFEENGYNQMADYLNEKQSLSTTEELMEHFYYNRNFWRKHVRMPTYSPEEHARNIRLIHDVIATDKEFSTIYDGEVKKYFENFERKCAEGRFAELDGVARFVHVGVAPNGLDEWIRLSGSVRCENFHMIMRRAMGPWGVGAELAHFLLVLIGTKYNTHCSIRRQGSHDFGHWHLYIMDELQAVIQDIYNVVPFPRHHNVMLSKPVKGFVAVGIGPLSISERFVQHGPPSPVLKSGAAFIARQMGVTLPPLPPSDPKEYKIMNDYWIRHPRPTRRNHEELAALFLLRSEGVRIFPKLPSMFPKLFKERQKRNAYQKIIGRLQRSGQKYGFLLRQLEDQRAESGTVASCSIVDIGVGFGSSIVRDGPAIQARTQARTGTMFDIRQYGRHRAIASPQPTTPLYTQGLLDQSFDERDELCLWRVQQYGDDKDVVAESQNCKVTRKAIRRLLGGLWLNDESINFFCRHVCSRLDSRVYLFNTFFFTKLTGEAGGYNYDNVRRWTNSVNIFDRRLLVVPINISNAHWVLAVVFVEQKRVWFWDSYGTKGSRVSSHLLRYLNDEHRTKLDKPLPTEWFTSYDSRKLQTNGVDCGAFVCTVIYLLLSNHQELNFNEAQMTTARKRIALLILRATNGAPGPTQRNTATVEERPVTIWPALTQTGPVADTPRRILPPVPHMMVATSSSGQEQLPNCFYFPYCQQPRSSCGGSRRGLCQKINEDEMLRVNGLSYGQFLDAKREAKNRLKAKRANEAYHAKKVAKQKIK